MVYDDLFPRDKLFMGIRRLFTCNSWYLLVHTHSVPVGTRFFEDQDKKRGCFNVLWEMAGKHTAYIAS